MLKFLDKIFWLAVYVIILAVVFILARLLAFAFGWPAWSALLLTVLAIVGFYALRYGLYWWRRRREERMATKLLEADAESAKAETPIDPEVAIRMNLTWKSGIAFLSKSRLGKIDYAYKLPWFVAIGDDDAERSRLLDEIAVKGAEAKPIIPDPEFDWHFARNAVWIDLAMGLGEENDERWRIFVSGLVHNRGKAPLGGVLIMLDAGKLLSAADADIKDQAASVRSRLDTLIKITGARVPAYVLINGIDAIYGMRALASDLPHAALDEPFGAFRLDEREAPGAFASRLLREAAGNISLAAHIEQTQTLGNIVNRNPATLLLGQAAAFQAPDELPRLAEPVSLFCREVFSDNPYQMVPVLRGLFLGTAGVSERVVPSLLSNIPSFRPESGQNIPAPLHRSWFFHRLLEEWIPRDPSQAKPVRQRRHFRAVTVYSGLAGLLAGTLILCWLMALSFFEARSVLDMASDVAFEDLSGRPASGFFSHAASSRAAAGAAEDAARSAAPGNYLPLFGDGHGAFASADDLGKINTFLDTAMQVELRNRRWFLPRLGMTQPLELQERLRDSYCDNYYEHILVPAFDAVRESAVKAVGSSDPREIGNTMIFLVALRKGLEGRLSGQKSEGDIDLFFSLADMTGDSADLARTRLQMYMRWVDTESWMKDAASNFLSLERSIITDAFNGDVMAWLPAWIDGLNRVQGVDTTAVWAPVLIPSDQASRRVVRGAWTINGYQQAKKFLEAIVYDDVDDRIWAGKRDMLLAQYRSHALNGWRDAVYELWRNYQAYINDADLPVLIKQVASADGPTHDMNDLLQEHLVPMFDGVEAPPDIEWLRLHHQYAASANGMAAMNPDKTPSIIAKLVGGVGDVVRRISSDDSIALLSKNIGFSTGNDSVGAMENYLKLNKSYADISFLTGARDSCIDLVATQFRRASSPAATLSAVADKTAGTVADDDDAAASNISKDPFGDGKAAADALNIHLTTASGSSLWLGVSPKATYNYLRYLATRQAAVHLNAKWIENVYNPTLTASGNEDEKMDAMFDPGGTVNKFLNETSVGLWRVEHGALANSVWDELPFMFNDNFLRFCAVGIANASVKYPEKLSMNFRVDSVSVDGQARERPYEVVFEWREGNEVQDLVYRNYVTARAFEWKMDRNTTASVIVSFPSVRIRKDFTGWKALGRFVDLFNQGPVVLDVGEFQGETDVLARLGVTRITIRTTMQNQNQILKFMNVEVPTIPSTIITPPNRGASRPSS